MDFVYKPRGVCSREIRIVLEDDQIREIEFIGGCNGNQKGISMLCKGRAASEVIESLKGIRCGFKETSCPDQLACALEQAISKAHEPA